MAIEFIKPTKSTIKKLIKDLSTSWIGIFGPGCGPTQLFASSGVTITGGTVFVEPDVEGQLWHTGDSMISIFILISSIIRVHKIIEKYFSPYVWEFE